MTIRTRERLGAATGLVAAALLGVSFIVGLSPEPPDLDAPATAMVVFVAQNQDALRVEILLNTVAMLFFLWFLGSVRAGLRGAEGGVGRVSAIASGGGLVGTGFVLLAQVFAAAATLRPLGNTPTLTRALLDLDALSTGIGGAAFAVFFLAVAVAILMDGGLPKVLGVFALLAAVVAMIGVATHFSTTGVFAADGAFGYWVRYGVFVGWTLLASLVLMERAGQTKKPAAKKR
jgi:hypothetical protein